MTPRIASTARPLLLPLTAAVLSLACASLGSQQPSPADEGLLSGEERGWRPANPEASGRAGAAEPGGAVCANFVRPGVLRRAAVVRTVDAGLGQWLSQVRVAAVRSGGRFQGWQIVQFYPGDPCYQVVDLRPGDLVTRVNGDSLERPEQANAVFQRLRTARTLDVELVREGVARRVALVIAD